MPKPIPPPPPQPSPEETVLAIRYLRLLTAITLGFFLLLASRYQYDAFMVDYGRDDGPSWALWRARTLDEARIRSHDGGKIVWMIGSSVLRDSFDQPLINEVLAERGSEWRVFKTGMPRGAPGMAVGLLDELPVRPGDRVLHTVSMDNFHKDWIHHVGLPTRLIAQMRSPAEIWKIEEYAFQERLEYVAGVPYNFYRHHESYMTGLRRWLSVVWFGRPPKKMRPGRHLTYRDLESARWLKRQRKQGEDSPNHMSIDDVDLSASQFNVAGLEEMRRRTDALGATLLLIDVPYRQELAINFNTPAVRERWSEWRALQPELSFFPQLPEDHYYDLRHPNSAGRAALTRYLLDWMEETPRGRPTPPFWTPENP